MKVYENLAPYYDRFMDHINYEQEAENIYRFLFQINKMNGRLLDIGAGSGGHLLPLLSMGIKADGLDYSEEMIEVLKKKIGDHHFSAHLYTADMRDFTTEHRYDVIYC
ncbi:MAG: class I SAM-dependent methyltransferase, partial [Firmicutes bacterium]|nr:class I SAM-dependent methyltransferase [Bacillota bacterium]